MRLSPKTLTIDNFLTEHHIKNHQTIPLMCVCVNTYYNEKNKIDEVVEGVCIHHIVHDVYPTLQSNYLNENKQTKCNYGNM